MLRLGFVITCMGRLAHLKQTLPLVIDQKNSSCIVVDYSCPDRSGDWVNATYSQARVVRVPGRKTFSRASAVNAGGWEAETPWICFLDSDIFIDPEFAGKALPLLEPGYYYGADPIMDPALCGTFICSRENFRQVGGYDEVYKGWGEEDFDIYAALEFMGLKRKTFPSSWIRHLPHGNESRVQFHEIKQRDVARTINRIYRFVKLDKMHATEGFLPVGERERLYEEIATKVVPALREGKNLDLTVEIPGRRMVLHYELEGIDDSAGDRIARTLVGVARTTVRKIRKPKPESVNLRNVMYQRNLPFDKRLELTVSSTGSTRNAAHL